MTIFLLMLAVVGSLALSAFCSGSETGFLSVRRGRVIHMAREGGARAKVVWEAISNMGRTLTAILVGNNLANVSYSSASAALSAVIFPGSSLVQTVWWSVAAFLVLYLGEFLPKLFSSARPLRRMLMLAPIWKWFAFFFVPVGAVVQQIVEKFIPRREAKQKVTPEMVLKILEDRKDGVKLTHFERALIERILLLRSRGEFVVPDALLGALDDSNFKAIDN